MLHLRCRLPIDRKNHQAVNHEVAIFWFWRFANLASTRDENMSHVFHHVGKGHFNMKLSGFGTKPLWSLRCIVVREQKCLFFVEIHGNQLQKFQFYAWFVSSIITYSTQAETYFRK